MVFELREWTGSKQLILVKNIPSLKEVWALRDNLKLEFPDRVITIFCRGGKWNESAAN